jgi:sec-independent protein translocase protein TatA
MLPSVGGSELLIILVIILLLFGAKRVPQLGRSLGNGIREFRQGISGASNNNGGDEGLKDEKEEDRQPATEGESAATADGEASQAEKVTEATHAPWQQKP